MSENLLIPREYCDHEYQCIHFDGRYRCRHCGDVCYHGVNGSDTSHLKIEDMVRELVEGETE